MSEATLFANPEPPTPLEEFTERIMLNRLHDRYSAVNPGNGPRYVSAEHVRSKLKPGELPEGWGLMVLNANGKLRAKVTAPRLNPEPFPLDLAISFAAAAARTATRRAGGAES